MNNPLATPAAASPAAQDVLTALVELLEQEYAALRRADSAAVTGIASNKRRLTDTLADTMANTLAGPRQQTAVPAMAASPAPLTDLVRQCHDLNRRNGELLRLQQGMLTRAMRVLSGADASSALYGARGETHLTSGSRLIASV